MKHQQPAQSERDAHPPQSCMGLPKDHPPQDGLDTQTNRLSAQQKTQNMSGMLSPRLSAVKLVSPGMARAY